MALAIFIVRRKNRKSKIKEQRTPAQSGKKYFLLWLFYTIHGKNVSVWWTNIDTFSYLKEGDYDYAYDLADGEFQRPENPHSNRFGVDAEALKVVDNEYYQQ